MPSFLVISLIIFLTVWSATAAPNPGKGYNADQIQDGSYLPCDSKAEVSFCCPFGYICLSNGLCEPSDNLSQYDTPYFTSTYTDYSWNSPSTCLEICNNNKINPSNGTGVKPCGNDDYCYYGLEDSRCCSTQSLLFSLGSGPATIQTTLGSISTSTTPTTNAALSTASSVLPSSRPSSSPSAVPSALSKDPSPPAATSVNPSPISSPSSNHVAVGVGIGVGVPAGLAVLAGLVYLIRRRWTMSDDREGITAYLDNKKELDVVSRKVVHEASDVAVGSRTVELSGPSLVELQHPTSP